MKVLLAGWNENALFCLKALLKSHHRVILLLFPYGYDTGEIENLCIKENICWKRLSKGESLKEYLDENKPDIFISASWPKIIEQEVLAIPKYGAINVHAALLPKNRGCHPLNWAIVKGEKETGVTVHYLDEGVDSGDIILQKKVPITYSDDINSIRRKIVRLGARVLVAALDLIEDGQVARIPQNQAEATFAPKRVPKDSHLNWQASSDQATDLIRALYAPYPNAFSFNQKGEKVEFPKVFRAACAGQVLFKYKGYWAVSTGNGLVLVKAKNIKVGDILV